jgi:hypothetical protein
MPRACLTGRGAHNPRTCQQPLVCRLVGEDVDVDWPGAVRAQIEADVRRVAERLRTLSEAQLAAEAPPYPSRAAGGRAVAQVLAEAAQAVEERESGAQPHWREVPVRSDFAVGDQLAVTGHDLLAQLPPPIPAASLSPAGDHAVPAASIASGGDHAVPAGSIASGGDHAVPAVGPEETVWARGTRRTAREVIEDAAAQLATLRRLL